MTSIRRYELNRMSFFPMLFAREALSLSRLTATAQRFACFLWDNVDGTEEDRQAWTGLQWQNYLSDPRCEFYAVYVDGEPAGCVELVRSPRLMRDSGGTVRIKALGLFPEYSGEGLGAALLTRVVEKGFATGADTLLVQTSQALPESLDTIMKRQGFRLVAS